MLDFGHFTRKWPFAGFITESKESRRYMKKWTGHTFDSARTLGTNNSLKQKP